MLYLDVYWKKYRNKFLLALLFLAFEAFADLLQPAFMAKIVDQGIARSNMAAIWRFGLLMLCVTAIGAVCASLRNILSGLVSQRFAQDLRQDLYLKIQKLPQTGIDHFGNATLIIRMTNDVTRVQTFANGLMRIMVKAPLVGIGSLIMAVHLNPRLSLVLLCVAPLIALSIMMNMKISYPYFREVQQALDQVNRSMQRYLAGIRVIRVFNRSEYEQKGFQKNNQRLADLTAVATKIGSAFGPLVNFTVNAGVIAILWFGAVGVNQGTMRTGSIIAFTNYMMQLLFALMVVNNAFNLFVRAKASAERIGEVMNRGSDHTFKRAMLTAHVRNDSNGLVFHKVTFSYKNTEQPVLSNVDFRIEAGETLGVTGPIASGKSTIVQLILRFYDPDQGIIYFRGHPLPYYSLEELRKRIAIVPQEPLLFSGSVKENIRWGNEKADEQAIIEAACVADADDFIRHLPNGYNSLVGQGGVNLSGGQKQRISIARALVRNPDLLILDDATSAVDAQTDREIRSRLKEYSECMTCIIISQKINSIKDANRIIVMSNGMIEASGTHQELLTSSPFYRDVCEAQMMKGTEQID
ncbi:ABC transporter ATP-binding protein/permease [Sporolactobacillus sp. CPB3-1]|uniref:ABC transporter ATP-binding protein/permease n=1 Tax=Sporolactobacillus mangiferae TaxID=2940498 RepID=A0ABT0MA55_9BACL|nr:ABC transporter ATP-binding protein [Sporolactobacillus mangiferae]MCL1631756.1 ABC transporter ATP-binding protein/permease [Sporolactobacillus mangiferae]